MSELAEKVVRTFREKWSSEPDVVSRAPGRVNLIGEHTDYTGGYVLPVAIDREIVFAAKRTEGNLIRGYSIDFDGEASCEAGAYEPEHPSGWFRYIMGVLAVLSGTGRAPGGFTFAFGGDIPIGAGLSSSAALETAVVTAMEELFGFEMDDTEAALLCQRAENEFVGMNCGIMDQFISRMGRRDHALFIDCNDLSHRYIPINLPGYTWVVIDSMKRRGLVDSEYNKRRRECEEALRIVRSVLPEDGIETLQDLSVDDLPSVKHALVSTVYKRLKHVVSENDRVLRTIRALEEGDAGAVGELLYESHASLRDYFEVSCEELDTLVDILSGVDGVCGARLTGAGFGGCVITLAETDAVDSLKEAVEGRYRPPDAAGDTKAAVWPIRVSDGAGLIR